MATCTDLLAGVCTGLEARQDSAAAIFTSPCIRACPPTTRLSTPTCSKGPARVSMLRVATTPTAAPAHSVAAASLEAHFTRRRTRSARASATACEDCCTTLFEKYLRGSERSLLSSLQMGQSKWKWIWCSLKTFSLISLVLHLTSPRQETSRIIGSPSFNCIFLRMSCFLGCHPFRPPRLLRRRRPFVALILLVPFYYSFLPFHLVYILFERSPLPPPVVCSNINGRRSITVLIHNRIVLHVAST